MRLRRRVGDGGGDLGDAAMLGAVGLGDFARLVLPDHPPEELGLAAAYDDASGRILVSIAGASGAPISASPADLAGALELPPGPVGLAKGVDAALFATAEAIAAVSGFVRDRVILGGGGDGGHASGEVAAALRLVEEGKAYEVDWGGLVWAVVKGEVVDGTPRRYAPYLIHLLERQTPGLFADFDGRLPRPKRWKGQQCQWDSVGFLALEEEEDPSLVYGGSQNIGDLEDMPIFGEGSDVKLLGHKMEYDDREGGCSRSSARRSIEMEDEDYNNVNVDVGPLDTTSYLPLQYVACQPLSTLSPFQACMSKILGYVPAMESRYLNLEKACRDTRDEVEWIKKMVMEKDHLVAATMSDMQEELRRRSASMRPYEADMNLMYRTIQQYDKLLEKSLAELQEVAGSDSEVLGISSGQNRAWVQHYSSQKMSVIDVTWSLKSSKLLKEITEVEMGITKLNHEVQRLKNSRSIPDLNNGVEDNDEAEASQRKIEDSSCASEGCHVNNTTLKT
ncbi:hypothetical protein SETIT_5G322700v2 [Setaria italica]|uniref:Uncharacterized protein n=2 Tax=Setaria TaxID=4554 RepID=A0A368RB29_SETIT|nr:uncharacterized protein LOC101755567 isoform X2 [Setaria italica]XP_034593446.1 uncharacterized protein LOC117855246 isoform X2 [Setaria viridis]RCV27405.1 hypothetical protein SETIT_5G322700v2 [Setaria italica]TKW16846.1 hypothetical protein SEVIR_5G326400v2 [Setaria viridis]